MSDVTPVTLLSGSLGAGKTTLVNHLLSTADDTELAVLVNDMGSVNVDAELVADGSELDVDDGVAELSNGCICCELQDDLEAAVVRLARDRSFDHLVVEPSGISEPAPIARLFTTESRVAALYDIDAVVTVLDTPLFLDQFSDTETPERHGTEGDRPLSDLLVEQVELSNVVLLNKADQCTDDELTRARSLVGGLQPNATGIETTFSAVEPDRLLGSDRFDATAIEELPGWKRALSEDETDHDHHTGDETDHDHHTEDHDGHTHPDEVYGVSSTTICRHQPVSPARFASFLRELPTTVIRAKGTVWIAGSDSRITISQAGPSIRATTQGPWIATLPAVDREMYRSNRPDLPWHEEHGDRRTELVFIGTDYDETAIETGMIETFVDAETAVSPETHPFPTDDGEEAVIREP